MSLRKTVRVAKRTKIFRFCVSLHPKRMRSVNDSETWFARIVSLTKPNGLQASPNPSERFFKRRGGHFYVRRGNPKYKKLHIKMWAHIRFAHPTCCFFRQCLTYKLLIIHQDYMILLQYEILVCKNNHYKRIIHS